MKKNIFYATKSVQAYCFTFSCRFDAGFSSFFRTNVLTKKLFFYGTLLLLGFGLTPNSYGQLVGGAAVKANFGIDGDIYANVLQFGSLPNQNGTDDWFQTTYPGPGFGVIDQHMPLDPSEATPNTAFSRRQSITTPTPGYPFPIVHSGIAPNDGDYLWLDAVYGRDNYVKGGSAEKSYFSGTGDKNSDNPTTWSLGTSGSVPSKDDLVDVFAHLRGEGPRIPDATDPRPFTTLWAYAGASLAVTNGNKHVDFEFFRTALSTPADLNIPGKTGPDGGRTAFTFNADGSIAIPGTIIISIDYINGGTVPQVRIRVWMDETVFNNYDNSAPLRPFTIDKATAFEKGTDSGTFGYAAILENVGATNIFGRVNDNASTLAPPWGSFVGSGPDPVTDFQALQFVEIGINLTAFGLDKKGTQDPCSNILGSLMVKTRSSGGGPNEGAFGSELKDFAGPFLFGNTGNPPVVSVPDKTACSGTPVDLTAGATTNGGPIHYFTGSDYTGEILAPTTYTPAGTMTIYVRSESPVNAGCYGTSQFIVTVNTINPGTIAGDQTLCSPFDPAAFTSTADGTGSGAITYQWQMSTTGCAGTWSNIAGATSATYDAPAVSVITNFRRVATSTLAGVACSANSNCLTVTPNPIVPGVIAGDQIGCSPFDAAAFTSTTAGSTTGAGVISYQWQMSTTGCAGTWSNIAGATSATYDAPSVTVITNYRRVATSTLNGVACSANSNCLTVTPTGIVPGEIAGSQTLCSPFDPAAFTSVTPGSDHGVITYQWQSSTTSSVAGFTNISGATSLTYDAPAVAVKTWFRRVATSDVFCSDNSNVLVVTPNDIAPGTVAGDQTLCSPFDPAAFTSTTAGSTANGGVVTYQWQMSTTGCAGTWSNIAGATSATYDAPAVSVITNFRRVATSTLAGVACSANSNCLTVTPNPIVPGVIAGDQIGCSPFDAAAFTSTTAGSTTGAGVISYQWQMSTTGCAGTWSNIAGATSATYDAPSVTVITNYRRVATSTLNGVVCSANSNCLTVTPTGIVPGEIAGSQTLCSPFDPAAFTSVTPGSDHGVITYQWQSSTTSAVAGFSNIAGATSLTYDAPAVAVKTWFRRVATSDVGCSGNSNVLVVTPNDIAPGTIAGDQTLCSPFDPAAFTSTTAGNTANGGAITYQWQMSTTGCDGTFANIAGATSATYDAPAVSVVTNFRRVATSTLDGVACSANSNCLTVTPNPIEPGVIAGDQIGCSPFDAVAFTSTTAGSTTGLGVISYQWQMSTTGCDGTWSNIAGATSATYDAPSVTVITNYRRVVTSTLNGVVCSANSNCLTVTPTGIVPGEIAGSQTLCSPFDPAAFTSVTPGSDHGVITYQWQSSTTSSVAGFTNISGATSLTYDAPAVAVKTWFRRVATSDVFCSDNSNVLVVTPNDIAPGTVAGDQTLCSPFDPAAFTSTTAGSTVNEGVVTYQWQMSTTGCAGTWSNIAGATSATYDAPAVAVITNFRRVATSTLAGVACSANSNCLTVTPNPIVPGEIAGDQTGCLPFDAAAFTSTTAGSTTGAGVITYQWQMSTTGCAGTWSNIAGATSATYDAPSVTVITNYRRVATSTLNGVACSENSNCLTVSVKDCTVVLCTYTQGYYGNPGGTSCAGGKPFTTAGLIAKALDYYGGKMTIGSSGHSVYIMNNSTDIDALITVMPGGGGSKVLAPFDHEINSLPPNYLKNGRINNTLLAQTIALGLNIGLNTELGDLELKTGSFAVAAPEGGCGSDVPKVRECSPGGLTPVLNEYKYYSIPTNVINAISPKTVQGLFALANQALGGGGTNGLTLSEIANAIDLINNAFDECRIFIGYGVEPLVCIDPNQTLINSTLTSTARVSDTSFDAYPVPFKDQLTISYNFDYVTDVKVEVFDAQGALVVSKYDETGYLNKEVLLTLDVYKGQEQVFVVKLTTNRGSSVKKVMSSN
ncbi:T9SS type A sorting domain-containing protein [Flavobacterium limnophilum]|uniref:T9SS type A sorting domain-containing protein n=1 Tax=Flavobacterium limnophilum TaxID=3003262 RepID=UPI0024829B85|nr:T9SS type A sorting domain-containing protein [Flavobacterium limnophilum]